MGILRRHNPVAWLPLWQRRHHRDLLAVLPAFIRNMVRRCLLCLALLALTWAAHGAEDEIGFKDQGQGTGMDEKDRLLKAQDDIRAQLMDERDRVLNSKDGFVSWEE